MNTVEFYQEYGYMRDYEQQLRNIGAERCDSLARTAANQIKHLKSALKELVLITEIHSKETGNNFAWAEIDEAKKALGVDDE